MRAVATFALLLASEGTQAQADEEEAARAPAIAPYAAPHLPPPRPVANGVELSGHLDMETVSTVSGGFSGAAVPTAVLQVGGTLDTAAADLWPGGRCSLSLLGVETGGNLEESTGAVQTPSNIWAPDAFRLYRLSYRQTMGPARLEVGILDLNDFFDTTSVAGHLANASFGISPTLTANAPIATYPDPGLGLTGGLDWGRGWSALVGVWQGNPQTVSHLSDNGALYLAEAQYRWADRLGHKPVADLKLGTWHYASSNPDLGPSTGGGYAVAEAWWDGRGPLEIAAFLQGGVSPGQVNAVPYYLGAGMRIGGFLAGRHQDTLSLGFARARLRGLEPETVWELNYSAALHRGLYLQPDLQWIQNPGGVSPNALVLGLRVHLEM